jgi:hypothetical protein
MIREKLKRLAAVRARVPTQSTGAEMSVVGTKVL